MATLATKYLTRTINNQKGADFLGQFFQYYIILDIRTTKIYNVEEIIEIGLAITKSDYIGPLYSYNTFVKPCILKRVSSESQLKHGITYDPQAHKFGYILDLLTSKIPFIANALENGLIIIADKIIMEQYFPGQCELIQSMNDSKFPPVKEMKAFQQWCCIRDMYGVVRDIAISTQNYTVDKFNKEYYKTYSGLVKIYPRCVDKANALIPLLRMYSLILQRQFFPTTMVSIPSFQAEQVYSAIPNYFYFHNVYASSTFCDNYSCGNADQFDKDGIYTGDDEETHILTSTHDTVINEFSCQSPYCLCKFDTEEEMAAHCDSDGNVYTCKCTCDLSK